VDEHQERQRQVRSLKSGCLKNVVPVCARDRVLAGLS
jgi:hypothetical protein